MIELFYKQKPPSRAEVRYGAGCVDIQMEIGTTDYIVAYETNGAIETFSIGQPVYDYGSGELMGFLGIGCYNNLNMESPVTDAECPAYYWRICKPTAFCKIGNRIMTYWQRYYRNIDEENLND
jgi:hypothetical protein